MNSVEFFVVPRRVPTVAGLIKRLHDRTYKGCLSSPFRDHIWIIPLIRIDMFHMKNSNEKRLTLLKFRFIMPSKSILNIQDNYKRPLMNIAAPLIYFASLFTQLSFYFFRTVLWHLPWNWGLYSRMGCTRLHPLIRRS